MQMEKHLQQENQMCLSLEIRNHGSPYLKKRVSTKRLWKKKQKKKKREGKLANDDHNFMKIIFNNI